MVLRKAFEGLRRAVSVSRRTTLFAIRNLTDPIHSKNCAHVMGMWIDHVKQKDIEEEDDNDDEGLVLDENGDPMEVAAVEGADVVDVDAVETGADEADEPADSGVED